jgi:hypothetical protein
MQDSIVDKKLGVKALCVCKWVGAIIEAMGHRS